MKPSLWSGGFGKSTDSCGTSRIQQTTILRSTRYESGVLQPLDGIRGELILALALCRSVDPTYGDAPMELDSHCGIDGIFVSGVFSRTAMMVVLAPFQELIPQQFSSYRLAAVHGEADADAKLLNPKTTFPTDTELVGVTWLCSHRLAAAHEAYAHQLHARSNQAMQRTAR